MSFNDFVNEYILKSKAANNIKIYQVLIKIGVDSKVKIYLRNEIFSTKDGILNFHPSDGTHWVCYIKDCYFDSYGFSSTKKILIT